MKYVAYLIVLFAVASATHAQDCGQKLKQELLQRATTDQQVRNALQASPTSKDALDATLKTDADNTAYMRRVLARCGWPKKSVVGPEAAKAAWLLTQHADMDPQYQVLAAQQMKYAVLAKEAEPWDLAVLVDRNRRLNDQPQVYGMQFFSNADGVIEFYDIVTPSQLDHRRKVIGLPPFFCWATRVSKDNKDAPIRWPTGVFFQPTSCEDAP
ncbi:DUF6624 domain-containing protein [Dyella caseinilytica]|uniref:Uncharacterized protein n=1 Tax=Dyella caseinilytica TaxID=1849581 RepID=A0ABX7GQ58_9GAMM|nr:DUF6624 domain-containing protein [Dyella caseinilytica]QRN52128.1 hypothetical protein ISN74_11520 [Dyella caseinilytica]GGA13580.1 hypothetical protein GCM10011408_38800 [Dyella caseinilytica]